jgi:hypothetical protein
MKKLIACLALAVAAAASADTTLDYTVLHAGTKSGAQKTVVGDDGRMHVSYSYRDNGRGPDIEEDIVLLPDGTMKSYRQRGKTTYGAELDERFSTARGRASWQSPSERGAQEQAGAAIYLPSYGSPETGAIIVRATQKAGGRLPALPGGELRSEKLADTRVGPAGEERAVALYAIFGGGLQPDYVWLEADEAMRLFASINVGGSHMVVAGYEGVTPELERMQAEAEASYLAGVAKKHTQALPQPILVRNVRVFDAAKKSLGEPSDVYVNDGRIAAIYPAGSPSKDPATVIEGAGRALLPGLFDMHTHENPWNSILQIAGGVTTSRDMGNDNEYLAKLRADIAGGLAIGPHIEPTGYIEGESPFASRGGFVVKNLEEAKHAIDWYAERGFRQVKLYNSIKPEWAEPIAAYAHSRGLRVSGHVPAFSRSARGLRRTPAHQPDGPEFRLGPGHRFAHDRSLQPGGRTGAHDRPRLAGGPRLHRAARRAKNHDRRDHGHVRGVVYAETGRDRPVARGRRRPHAVCDPARLAHQLDRRERRQARGLS